MRLWRRKHAYPRFELTWPDPNHFILWAVFPTNHPAGFWVKITEGENCKL